MYEGCCFVLCTAQSEIGVKNFNELGFNYQSNIHSKIYVNECSIKASGCEKARRYYQRGVLMIY